MQCLQNVDLAIGSMTINLVRESVIDFTKPFMNLGDEKNMRLKS